MRGEPFKRCGCKDDQRRDLGRRCPRLKERDHGSWFYRYSEPPGPDGRRRQPLVGPFSTKTAAAKDRVDRLSRLNQGLPTGVDRTTMIAEDFDRWLDSRSHLSPRTQRSDATIRDLYVRPGIGHLRLTDLPPRHLEDLYAAIRRIGHPVSDEDEILRRLLQVRKDGVRRVSPARLRRIHDVVHAYLAQRARQEAIPRNRAAHVQRAADRPPRALVWTDERIERWLRTGRRPSPIMVWTPAQTGLFLDFAAEDRHYALWHLIAHRGLRRGEACSLNRSELSLSRATVTIRTGEIDEPTKNQRSRTLGLDRATVEVLAAHRRRQLEQQELLGDLYEDSGLVFTDELGRPLNLTTVSHHFDRLLTRYEAIRRSPERPRGRGRPTTPEALASAYGMPLQAIHLALKGPPLPPVRLHDLRHGAASLTYRATRDLKLVSELLGHSGIQITADTYTTLFQEVDAAAAEAVAKLVPRAVRTTCAPEDKPDVESPELEDGPALDGL
jgi:integrase